MENKDKFLFLETSLLEEMNEFMGVCFLENIGADCDVVPQFKTEGDKKPASAIFKMTIKTIDVTKFKNAAKYYNCKYINNLIDEHIAKILEEN